MSLVLTSFIFLYKHDALDVIHMQNVVVVSQPTAPAATTVRVPRRANEYLALTVVLCVLCFLHGNLLAVVLLIPALICSCVVC